MKDFIETSINAPNTREWWVRADACPALKLHQIVHVGSIETGVPYSRVRTDLSGTYMLASLSGQGEILLDGRWRVCRAGWAALTPPHALLAFRAMPKFKWNFCWVKYEQPPKQKPIISSSSPVLARYDPQPIHSAIMGLFQEVNGTAAAAPIHHWVELIQTYVLRFAQPWHVNNRLLSLWENVNATLGEKWTIQKLAQKSNLSREHLRRLCRQQLGRSPMHQVIYLRMQKAAELLSATDEKIETIAGAVGYENPFVFSNTFKKWTGVRPSQHRSKTTSAIVPILRG
ncbi:MAG: AraC family transcriptional regulator [Limisphaerales bacterium]